MAGMDGMTATRRIREKERPGEHIPIIALTAHALQEAREACLAAGMDEVLVKPLQMPALRAAIKEYCDQPREKPSAT